MTQLDFPTRSHPALVPQIIQWAETTGHQLPTPDSKENLYRHILRLCHGETEPNTPKGRRLSQAIIREYYEDVTLEDISPAAMRQLARFIADAGALNVLRLVAYALLKGAGLDPEYDSDPARAVVKYAAAVWNGEKREVRR